MFFQHEREDANSANLDPPSNLHNPGIISHIIVGSSAVSTNYGTYSHAGSASRSRGALRRLFSYLLEYIYAGSTYSSGVRGRTRTYTWLHLRPFGALTCTRCMSPKRNTSEERPPWDLYRSKQEGKFSAGHARWSIVQTWIRDPGRKIFCHFLYRRERYSYYKLLLVSSKVKYVSWNWVETLCVRGGLIMDNGLMTFFLYRTPLGVARCFIDLSIHWRRITCSSLVY